MGRRQLAPGPDLQCSERLGEGLPGRFYRRRLGGDARSVIGYTRPKRAVEDLRPWRPPVRSRTERHHQCRRTPGSRPARPV